MYIYTYIYLHAFSSQLFRLQFARFALTSIQGTMAEDGGLFNKKGRSDEPELPYAKKAGFAMKYIMDKNEAGQIFDGAIYKLLEVECAALLPHVTVLSGGQMRKDGGGKLNAYKAASVDPIAAKASAKYVYAWLHAESTLRSILKFLAKGGCFYTAFANEKLTRAYIVGNKVTEDDFIKLCLHRLSSPESADDSPSADRVTDWAAVKAG